VILRSLVLRKQKIILFSVFWGVIKMKTKVFCAALLGLIFAIPSQAAVIYSASGNIGGTATPDLGYVPSFTIQLQFTYSANDPIQGGPDMGTLVDEEGNINWHDSQLEVQGSGHVLASVWPYYPTGVVIDLGVVKDGSNTVSYGYNLSSQTIFGQLNGGAVVSAIFGIRLDPVSSGYDQQVWAFGQGDGTFIGVEGAYNGPISSAIISTGGVPEPSTWAMMLAGFAGLGFLGYRRNKGATLAV
jgi:hypothetical protein